MAALGIAMDFAIVPASDRNRVSCASAWAVLCLSPGPSGEVATRLASFGHRQHAEAFLADLLAPQPVE